MEPSHASTERGAICLVQVWWRRRWLTHAVVRSVSVFDGTSLVDGTGRLCTASGSPPLRPGRAEHKPPSNGVGEALAVQRRRSDAGAAVFVAPVAAPSEPMHKEGKIRRYAPRLLPCHSVHATIWSRRVRKEPEQRTHDREVPAVVVSRPLKSDAQLPPPAGKAPEVTHDAQEATEHEHTARLW